VSDGTIITLVLVLVLIAVAAAVAGTVLYRRTATRQRYGDEYNRLVRDAGSRQARAEFAARQRRVEKLGIQSLSAERQVRYTAQWDAAQERFIDSPAQAVRTAASLVAAVAADRGYEVADMDQLLTDLSVHYGQQLDGYRRALGTTGRAESAATEELRQALLDHRALFRGLVGQVSAEPGRPLAQRADAGSRPATDVTSAR
jgi:hypothetical protein